MLIGETVVGTRMQNDAVLGVVVHLDDGVATGAGAQLDLRGDDTGAFQRLKCPAITVAKAAPVRDVASGARKSERLVGTLATQYLTVGETRQGFTRSYQVRYPIDVIDIDRTVVVKHAASLGSSILAKPWPPVPSRITKV